MDAPSGTVSVAAGTVGGMGRSSRHEIDQMIDDLLYRSWSAPRSGGAGSADVFDSLAQSHRPTVSAALEARFTVVLSRLWANGWLPGEVIRQVGRAGSADGVAVISAAVAADHRRRHPDSLHPRWRSHVDDLQLPDVAVDGWLPGTASARNARASWSELLATAIHTLQASALGGPLTTIIPPPGSDADDAAPDITSFQAVGGASILAKIRQLLAQAESTNFDAEAEVFTAKAHELMARHALDAAAVWSQSETGEQPGAVRVAIDEPYVAAKSLLLQVVAEGYRCRTVFHRHYAFSTLVGFVSDLAAAETLYTSLLIQAQQALGRVARSAPAGARTRSRRYRSSFLRSYALRIDERLTEINDQVRSDVEADTERSLLPVLARRNSLVDDTLSELFPDVSTYRIGGSYDLQGHTDGRSAADRADLNPSVDNPTAGALPAR